MAETSPPAGTGAESLSTADVTTTHTPIRSILNAYAGVFLFVFVGAVAYGVFWYLKGHQQQTLPWGDILLIGFGLLVALVALLIGTRIMVRDATAPAVVIPPQDRQLLEQLAMKRA